MGLLASILGGGVGKLVKDVVGTFKLDPETKAKIDLQLLENEFQLKKLDAELEARALEVAAKEAEVAGANIRAEAASDSWLAKNCRPAFIFGAGMTLLATIWLPLIGQVAGHPIPPFAFPALPSEMYWLFGAGFLGYTGARSWEKAIRLNGHK